MAHGFTGSCICRGTSRHGDKEADGELSGQMPPLPISTLSNVHCCFPKKPPVTSFPTKFDQLIRQLLSPQHFWPAAEKMRLNAKPESPITTPDKTHQWPVTSDPSYVMNPVTHEQNRQPGNSKQNNTPPHTQINLVIWPVALCGLYRSLRFCKSSSGGDLTKLWSI